MARSGTDFEDAIQIFDARYGRRCRRGQAESGGSRLALRMESRSSRFSPRELRGLVGGKLCQSLIASNWPDILRLGATLAGGTVAPSLMLRKLAAYPRRNHLAAALREVGRIGRTLFMIEWALDPAMRRRAQIGLNKRESYHALKNALRIGRQEGSGIAARRDSTTA